MQQSRAGRPRNPRGTDSQATIIAAASQLFSVHGIRGTSIQMLADTAGVTPAMIHYWFKSKDLLGEAVIDLGFSHVKAALETAATLDEWVAIFHDNLIDNPWIPHLVIREVIPETGQLQPYFLKNFARAAFAGISRQIQAETYRLSPGRALDLERLVMLLMGMLIYPFIGRGLAEKVTGRTFDETMMLAFRQDALTMFRAGLERMTQETRHD